MIIAYDVLLGYVNVIVFQLTERIATIEKSMKTVLRNFNHVQMFSYNAIPTRHEVPGRPYLQEENIPRLNKPTKLLSIADAANQIGGNCWSRFRLTSNSSLSTAKHDGNSQIAVRIRAVGFGRELI